MSESDAAYRRKLANDEANRQAMIRILEQQAADKAREERDRRSAAEEAARQRQESQNIRNNYS